MSPLHPGSERQPVAPHRHPFFIGLVLLLGLGLVAVGWKLFEGHSRTGFETDGMTGTSTENAVRFDDPVTVDLTRFGIRAVIDVPGNAAVTGAAYEAVIRFPDGSELSIVPTSQSAAMDMAHHLAGGDFQVLMDSGEGYLLRSGPPERPTFHGRHDLRVGGRTLMASGSWPGSATADPTRGQHWRALRSLRQTDEQIASETTRAAALARLSEDGITPSTDPAGGLAIRLIGPAPDADKHLRLLADIPDVTAVEITEGVSLTRDLLGALRNVSNLRKLILIGQWANDEVLDATATGCVHLEDLRLSRTAVTDHGLAAIAGLTNLRSLAVTRDPSRGSDPAGLIGPGLKQLARLTGLRELVLSGQRLNDAGLSHLPDFPDLRHLDLSHTRITDDGLRSLKSVGALRSLDLSRTGVTGAGLSRLTEAKQLETLNLAFSDVTDAGLVAIRGLPVKSLDLSATRTTDAGLVHVGTMADLVALDLSATRVTDAGLRELTALSKLSGLNLRHSEVTGSALNTLRRSPFLYSLDLTGSPCGDEALEQALALPKLARLGLADTRVTDAGLRYFDNFPEDRPLSVALEHTNVTPFAATDWAERLSMVSGINPPKPEPIPFVPPPTTHGVGTGAPDPEGMLRRTGALATTDTNEADQPVVAVFLAGANVTDADLADLRGMPQLRSLTIRSDRVTDSGLAYLAALSSLTELHISGRNIGGEGFIHLAGMRNLRKLSLPSQPLPPRALAYLSALRGLEYLDIPDDATAASPAALSLYAELPNLRRIDLKRVGNNDLLRLRGLTALTELRFRTWSERVSRWGLTGIAELAELRRLTVEGGVDDRGLAEIAKLSNLESLEITNGAYITDDGAAALAIANTRRLTITGSRIGDAGLARLLQFSSIEELDLSGSRVTDRGLTALIGSGVKVLNLANTDLTDACIPFLAEVKGLHQVILSGTRVTSAGVALLKESVSDLVVEH